MSTFTNTLFVGKVLMRYDNLDSTNKHALNLLSKNKPSEGTVITAWNQGQGRGQIGRTWLSEAGMNLTFSIIFYPKMLTAKRQFILNQAVTLGVYDYISQYISDVKIKWPNDIYVTDRKICGILIQNLLSGSQIQSSVIGIGLNVNQTTFDSTLPNPTSMGIETNEHFDLDLALEQLCEKIETRYLQVRGLNHDLINKHYLQNLYRFQENALFQYPEGDIFNGKIVGVSETGKLRIHNQKGEEQFDVREIIFVL